MKMTKLTAPAITAKGGTVIGLAAALIAACSGAIGDHGVPAGSGPPGGGGGGPAAGPLSFGPTGLHRLSRIEYDNTLRDLLGDGTRSGFAKLPEDVNDPFDNDYKNQLVSGALI